MTYTVIPAQIQCDGCKKIQDREHKYCCNCGGKFEQVGSRPEFVPERTDRSMLEDWIAAEKHAFVPQVCAGKSCVTLGEHVGIQTNGYGHK